MANETSPEHPVPSQFFRLRLTALSSVLSSGLLFGICLVGGLLIGGFLASGPASAADDRPQLAQTETPGWQSECREERCAVSRSMFGPDSKQRVAALTFLFEKGETGSVLVITSPLGVALAPGLQLVTGEATIDVPIQVCLPDGCQATHRLTEVDLSRIGALGAVDLRYFPFGKGDQPLSVRIPMEGLTATVEGLAIR